MRKTSSAAAARAPRPRAERVFSGRGGQAILFTAMALVILLFAALWMADVHRIVFVKDRSQNAGDAAALADLHLLADALERYYLRFGDYPLDTSDEYPTTDLLAHTRSLPGNPGDVYVFSNSLPRTFTALDPWGEAYQYIRHGNDSEGIETFTLYSLGPDRKEPGEDDTPDDNIRL